MFTRWRRSTQPVPGLPYFRVTCFGLYIVYYTICILRCQPIPSTLRKYNSQVYVSKYTFPAM